MTFAFFANSYRAALTWPDLASTPTVRNFVGKKNVVAMQFLHKVIETSFRASERLIHTSPEGLKSTNFGSSTGL